MLFNYRYHSTSLVESGASSTGLSFAPDTFRKPTFFSGKLRRKLAFREAISALHDVVVSDQRFKPRDTSEYEAWAAERDLKDLGIVTAQEKDIAERIRTLGDELSDIRKRRQSVMAPFYRARQQYFNYLYKKERDVWFVLDPVITVHPDELFFECFSQDESSYGRLGASYEVFQDVGEFSCGTTNVDYSAGLYDEFQKIRDYKTTDLTVDPSGFQVETELEEQFKEVKIDLPESWVRGFLQVSSAMTWPAKKIRLHPMDVHNICFMLRQRRERKGPRSIRFQLEPGKPVKAVFEPWNIELACPRSLYEGSESDEIRVWGRRRLLLLERLIPVAKSFTAYLLGTGMPSFFVAELGDMSFTLGLSGWTANDWSRAGNFDLLAARSDVDDGTKQTVFEALGEDWMASSDTLARRLSLHPSTVSSALAAYTQAGRVMYDLDKSVYRLRELSREPLPMESLRFSSPREESASQLVESGSVRFQREMAGPRLNYTGQVKDQTRSYQVELFLDSDDRLVKAECSCSYYIRNKLYRGPCEHILALRMMHGRTS